MTVVNHAAPVKGERVLDVGCGTGNAALLAAERGAHATGIDPAERLLDVARAQARRRGLDGEFVRGEAEALPLPDAGCDVVVSVFGVIFSSDASAAVAELARVTAARGRLVFSAWIPSGPMFVVMSLRREAMAEVDRAPSEFRHPWRLRRLLGMTAMR